MQQSKTDLDAVKVKQCYAEIMELYMQTATLKYEISTMWEMRPRMTPQKTSRLSMELEQITRSKTLQPI
jgi:hypothetical protein